MRTAASRPLVCQCGCDRAAAVVLRARRRRHGGLGFQRDSALVLSQQDLNDPFQAGVQFTVGHTFGDSPYQVEASYFWVSAFDSSAQVADPFNNLYSPFTTNHGLAADPALDENSQVAIHLVSRLESGDINVKCALPLPSGDPTIMALLGVRHLGVREEFDYSSLPSLNPNPAYVHAHTNNNLWGPQIGTTVDYGHQDTWVHFEGKFRPCNNDANRNLEADANAIDVIHPRQTRSCTAMVGDVTLSVLWRPTSAIVGRIGYQALWVDQVALAGRNYAFDEFTLADAAAEPPINQRGTLIYHGPFAGLQLSW